MTHRASGTFDVKLKPQPPEDLVGHPSIGRLSIEKQYHGELEAISTGQMLAAQGTDGSAGYVALERVSGKLQGRIGTFALQHSGTMTRGVPALSISVVPDSGTGQLVGLEGNVKILNVDKLHSYEFEYTLAVDREP